MNIRIGTSGNPPNFFKSELRLVKILKLAEIIGAEKVV